MLWSVARVHSAADLDHAGRHAVLDHLRARGFVGRVSAPTRGRPHNINSEDRGPLLRKIWVMLADSSPSVGLCARDRQENVRVADCTFCNPEQLRGIVAALNYDRKRRDRRGG